MAARRRKLELELEDFYLACLARFGAPTRKPFRYVSTFVNRRGMPWQGVMAWCRFAPDGIAFTRFVRECGDAGARAPLHYKAWEKWWQQRNHTVLGGSP